MTGNATPARALITGIGGFVGRHLTEHLLAAGDAVVGLGRAADCTGLPLNVPVHSVDLLDRPAVESVLREVRPDVIYHLAAQSSTSESLADPWSTLGNNLHAQLNLLEGLRALGQQPRVLVIGSSDEYGRVRPEDQPTREDAPLRPTSPYAVSKVGQDVMGYQYFAQYGLPIVRVRPFTHTGPGQDDRFVVPSWSRQIAEIEVGKREPVLRVGNLDVERDFTDVRDIVQAYRLAVLEGAPGEVYNLGRGAPVRLRDTLSELVALSRADVRIEVDPARLRPSDMPTQQADTRRFKSLCGWRPTIPWQTTLRDTLDYWRARVATAASAMRP